MRRRVVLLGKNRLAVECLRVISEAGDDIVRVAVDPRDDGSDAWQPSLRGAALRAGLPVLAADDLNATEIVSCLAALRADFLFSCQFGQILKPRTIGVARLATLNLHFGPLPRYRGVAAVAWALINGESETGVTLHHMDPGVDSGDIVGGRSVPIGPDDTARSLYEKCTDAGVKLFADWYPRLRAGDIPRTPQDPSRILYYNRYSIDFSHDRISWSWDAERVARWVRAYIFPPFQLPTFELDGERYEVGGVKWDRAVHRGRPGEILTLAETGVIVAVPGGRIVLTNVGAGGRGLEASDLSRRGFAPGKVLT